MAVYSCSVCARYISVSVNPLGNPVALKDPAKWSLDRGTCAHCNIVYCDRCIAESKQCRKCGGNLEIFVLPRAKGSGANDTGTTQSVWTSFKNLFKK